MQTLFNVTFFLFLFSFNSAFAQNNPVSWSFESEPQSDGVVILNFTATIEDKWVVYSPFTDPEGPVPTSFIFSDANSFQPLGIIEEKGKRIEGFDKMFNLNVIKFKDKVTFSQKIKIDKDIQSISGFLTYMTCDGQVCMPPTEIPFEFSVN